MANGGYPVLSVDPTAVNEAAATRKLGTRYSHYDATYGWRTLKYIQNQGAVASIAGSVASLGVGIGVTSVDRDSDSVAGDFFGGVHIAAVTADYYGFVVCGIGDRCFVSTGGSVAAGDIAIVDPGNDKVAISWAPTTTAPTVLQMLQGAGAVVGMFPEADATLGGTCILLQGA